MIEWLTALLIQCMTGWRAAWLTDRLIGWLPEWIGSVTIPKKDIFCVSGMAVLGFQRNMRNSELSTVDSNRAIRHSREHWLIERSNQWLIEWLTSDLIEWLTELLT